MMRASGSEARVHAISAVDWAVIVTYLVAMVAFGLWLARKTKSGEDYYLAGRNVPPLVAAMSIMATQTSTISLIGAPAFVAIDPGGGLRWLQWEIAVPIAMIAIMVIFVPLLWRSGVVTIYEFLERRFGLGVRLTLSAVFLVSRALATGVTVFATAVVLHVATGAPIAILVAVIGLVCLVYSTLGGLVADVWTDAVQLVVLWGSVLVSIGFAVAVVGDLQTAFSLEPARATALDFAGHGLGDGETFGFWPLVIGGAFLYVAYYGTDQTQVQRVLAAPSVSSGRKSLFFNGLMRFPLVLTYCLFGAALAAVVVVEPELARDAVAKAWELDNRSHYNYLVPLFIVRYLPAGMVGIIIAGMMAASMSSLDSTFNSLSAATMRDFVERFGWVTDPGSRRYVLVGRAVTFVWGMLCCAFAFVVGGISPTVIESINKIGSVFYGPVLAVFVLAFLTRWVTGRAAVAGLALGVALNLDLWLVFPGISWLWWNLFSFLLALAIAVLLSLPRLVAGETVDLGMESRAAGDDDPRDRARYALLALATIAIVMSSWGIGRLLACNAGTH